VHRLRKHVVSWTDGQDLVQTLASSHGVRRRVEALLHDEVTGPMTFGVMRPSIILPVSAQHWDEASLRRALRHELEHIARWDFLTLCLSRVVCAVYWFHPLVWAAWSRLRLEAERACDDAVVAGDDATEYASMLVSMAERAPDGGRRPLLAMASRKDLATRVAALLDLEQARGRIGFRRASGTIVAAAIAMLVAAPITVARAMPQAPPAAAPVAAISIKRYPPAQITWRDGRLVASNVTVRELLRMAYSVHDVVNAPRWVQFDRFDITTNLVFDQVPERGSRNLQSFLTDRFKLQAHLGSKEFPIYALVQARRDGSLGPRLMRSTFVCSVESPCGFSTTHGRTTGRGVTMAGLASHFLVGSRTSGQVIDRELMDRTGLDGRFDLTVEWTPDDTSQAPQYRPFPSLLAANAPNLLAALEEQLGLRIESQLAPKPVLIIDSIEQPAEN
jgi:uncharacterized protein (TIGR03435 family)